MMGYIKSVYGSTANAYFQWVHRNPHWYAGGTDSAAPGWAVVGGAGPELVNMRGGETVLPVQGFAKGGRMRLSKQVDRALDIIRHHPFAPDRLNRLSGLLDHVRRRIHAERALLGANWYGSRPLRQRVGTCTPQLDG
jgi:SLT domain-containing protein